MFGTQHYINCATSSSRNLSLVYPRLTPGERVNDLMLNCLGVCVRVNNNTNLAHMSLSQGPLLECTLWSSNKAWYAHCGCSSKDTVTEREQGGKDEGSDGGRGSREREDEGKGKRSVS